MVLAALFVRPVVRLLGSLATRPVEFVATILYHSDAIPRDVNLQRLVRSDLLCHDNYLFHFLAGFLRCLC